MKVRGLKYGRWATNPPEDDMIIIREGEEFEVEDKHAIGLIKYGYVEKIDSSPVVKPPQTHKPKRPGRPRREH